MNILEIIEKKRLKKALTYEEIAFIVDGFTKTKTIKDYQMASLLMAININGMDDTETFHFTDLMLKSGNQILVDKQPNDIVIDKHSTGGVGDKVSPILASVLGALDIKVAKLTGRGLAHTGGTADKLESIGVWATPDKQQRDDCYNHSGIFIMAQTEDINPADKDIYSLRNATGTVNSLPLIAASIVSKKLVVNADYIFLDVKSGSGAFCETVKKATDLAKIMLNIIKSFKRKGLIHITDMSTPLGRSIGNALEIRAVIHFLKKQFEDLREKELLYTFIGNILIETNKAKTKKEAFAMIDQVIENGEALKKFYQWTKAQGRNIDLDDEKNFFNPQYSYEIKAQQSGYIDYLSCAAIGYVSVALGAGRIKKDDLIDNHAGIYLNKTRNEFVNQDDVIATLYSSKPISQSIIDQFNQNVVYHKTKRKEIKVVQKVLK